METELMRQKEAAEVAKRAHELELARLRHENLEDRPRDREDRTKAPKLPSFVDGKDDLDANCRSCRSSRDLQRQLSGKKMDGHRSSVLCCLGEH